MENNKDFFTISEDLLRGVVYTGEHTPDELELRFIDKIASCTNFPPSKIHVLEVQKTKYKRKFNYYKFEYNNKVYELINDKIKEPSES